MQYTDEYLRDNQNESKSANDGMNSVGKDGTAEFHFVCDNEQHAKANESSSDDMQYLMNGSILINHWSICKTVIKIVLSFSEYLPLWERRSQRVSDFERLQCPQRWKLKFQWSCIEDAYWTALTPWFEYRWQLTQRLLKQLEEHGTGEYDPRGESTGAAQWIELVNDWRLVDIAWADLVRVES